MPRAKKAETKTVVEAPARKLFKVLVNGQSCHGGTYTWDLPKGDEPGAWHEHSGTLRMCAGGFHLTDKPLLWWKPGAAVFEAEADGKIIDAKDGNPDKVCVERVRLIREVTWAEHRVFLSGVHAVSDGEAKAFDSATVEAFGSATVEAFGSATVEAFGSATVKAFGSATVKAFGSATVEAFGSATVEAFGSATVKAFGSATVKAFGSATVEAFGSATVEAFGSATVKAFGSATVEAFGSATVIRTRYHYSSGGVLLQDGSEAVCIDRRNGVKVELAAPLKKDAA